jgi:hypothetical protein
MIIPVVLYVHNRSGPSHSTTGFFYDSYFQGETKAFTHTVVDEIFGSTQYTVIATHNGKHLTEWLDHQGPRNAIEGMIETWKGNFYDFHKISQHSSGTYKILQVRTYVLMALMPCSLRLTGEFRNVPG